VRAGHFAQVARLIRVHAKADLPGKASEGSLPVSALTGEGVGGLLEQVVAWARALKAAGAAMGQERETTRHERHRVDAPASAELTA